GDERDLRAGLHAELGGARLRVLDLVGPCGRLRADLEDGRAFGERHVEGAARGHDGLDVGKRNLDARIAAEEEVVRLEEDLAAVRPLAETHRAVALAAHKLGRRPTCLFGRMERQKKVVTFGGPVPWSIRNGTLERSERSDREHSSDLEDAM